MSAATSLPGCAYGPSTTLQMRIRSDEVESLPCGIASPADLPGRWLVAQVRGGYERRIAGTLEDAGVGFYLPMEEVYKKNGGGNRCLVKRLVFRSYVFACCRHEDDCYELVARDGVIKLIQVTDQSRFVREISAIDIASRAGLLAEQRPELQAGVQVEIVRGPLRGCLAWIDERDEKGGVVLKLTILGQPVPTTVPLEDVDVI
jgi:transcription antitermination factor NusG